MCSNGRDNSVWTTYLRLSIRRTTLKQRITLKLRRINVDKIDVDRALLHHCGRAESELELLLVISPKTIIHQDL